MGLLEDLHERSGSARRPVALGAPFLPQRSTPDVAQARTDRTGAPVFVEAVGFAVVSRSAVRFIGCVAPPAFRDSSDEEHKPTLAAADGGVYPAAAEHVVRRTKGRMTS